MEKKYCLKCGKELRSLNTIGYCLQHGQTVRAKRWRKAHPNHYKENRERMLEQAKKDNKNSYQRHKEDRKRKVKVYREQNWEEIKRKRRLSYDPVLERQKRSRQSYSSFLRTARRRKIEVTIDRAQFDYFINQSCFYCGAVRDRFSQSTWMDRKDSSRGYHFDNIVSCCGDCNYIKGDRLTFEEMIAVANLLKQMRSK